MSHHTAGRGARASDPFGKTGRDLRDLLNPVTPVGSGANTYGFLILKRLDPGISVPR